MIHVYYFVHETIFVVDKYRDNIASSMQIRLLKIAKQWFTSYIFDLGFQLDN